MARPFIFNGGDPGETPESVARRRAIADALLKQAMGYSQPKSVLAAVGQGLGDLGEVLAARRNNSRADAAEKAGRASVGDLSALFGGGGGDAGGSIAATGDGDIATVANPAEMSAAIQATAQKLGIDPVDLGTAISYETAGTFDPWKAGPTTQWGQHRGLRSRLHRNQHGFQRHDSLTRPHITLQQAQHRGFLPQITLNLADRADLRPSQGERQLQSVSQMPVSVQWLATALSVVGADQHQRQAVCQ